MSDTTTAVPNYCARCGQRMGSVGLITGGRFYHIECADSAHPTPTAADTSGLVERLTAERDESDRLTGETLREIEKIRHERDRLIEWRDAKPTGSRDQRERQMLKRTEAAEARAEASAQQLAAAPDMLAMLKDCRERLTAIIDDGLQTDFKAWRDDIDAALKARES